MIARVAPFSGANERTLFDQVVQIAGRGGKASPGNRPVISGAQPTRKAVRPFTKQTKQSLFLPFVDLPEQAIEQPRGRTVGLGGDRPAAAGIVAGE